MIENKFMISDAIDVINGQTISDDDNLFKEKTNFPKSVRLQVGARVMFLNNSQMEHSICNGTVGIITDVDVDNEQIRVAFSVQSAIVDAVLSKQRVNFTLNGNPASRTQFPVQNAFGLTVHKTQGLTLPKISVCLDQQIFAPGQAYVALSRCAKWEDLKINSLSRESFIVDQSMVREYARLEEIASKSLPINNNNSL